LLQAIGLWSLDVRGPLKYDCRFLGAYRAEHEGMAKSQYQDQDPCVTQKQLFW